MGGCGTVNLDQIETGLASLSCRDGIVHTASSGTLHPHMGDLPTHLFGKQVLQTDEIHKKSATRFLDEGAFIEIYGSTGVRASPASRVVETKISDHVAEVTGVPQQWGPPKLKAKGIYPYQATLVHSALPSLPIGGIIQRAVKCYKRVASVAKERTPGLFEEAKPLSRVQTVSGIAGKKFIDAMNYNTAPGFPLTGSKKPLLVELDPEDYPDIGKPMTFIPEVWDEFEKSIESLRKGERINAIWKSSLKDEVTKSTKDKVRVFQGAPLTLQLIVRMYFLPLVRIVQFHPSAFECAVGLNAEGPDWDKLWKHTMQYGEDRVLAGDYSKYDARMPAQCTIAAFDCLINIARLCPGYSVEDIRLMEQVVAEMVYPILNWNGDLIQLFGTNPSGQNLTVIINSFVNSLLLRSCFYTLYPEKDFKEHVAAITYGDDVVSTVSEDCTNFNFFTFAEFLSKSDMKFTMPDKESEPQKYLTSETVDFLKRKSVFNPDLGLFVGCLSEDSIFKRLHCHLVSKELDHELHSAVNIDSSLHDWFLYGREKYNLRQQQMRDVATRAGIAQLCTGLDKSYEYRVAMYRNKYFGEEIPQEFVDDEVVIC
jgi:hypothetical protein